ncbi:glycosyltransferase family 87 protein [Terriglobus sp. 2YAB30_2]|uniref:glycosyltransferase family 87 protein n=2 Tax=unclassified Terriglobus TaxID=2628988 RepID=UPI003F95636D
MKKLLRLSIAALILAIGVAFLSFAMSSGNAANKDFISYWAAGKQLLHKQNPYGPGILAVEKQAGFIDNRPFYMRNPPTAFPLAVLAALFSHKVSAILWSLGLVLSLMASVRIIWEMHGRPPDRLHLIGYLFPPALACLTAGQMGIFLLLGVVVFLRWKDSRPFLAGMALVVCGIKPHLFLPFVVLLLFHRRALLGAATAVGATVLFSLVVDPQAWQQYLQMVRSSELQNEFIPTLSLVLRMVHRSWPWLQLVPAAIACVWVYFKRPEWNLVLLVSVLVAPYAWVTDECIVLPAFMAALYQAKSLTPFACVLVVGLLEVLVGAGMTSPFYLWTPLAWLGLYLYGTRSVKVAVPVPMGS